MSGILAITEVKDGKFRRASLEAVGEALRIGQALSLEVSAVVMGTGVSELAGSLGEYGVSKAIVVEDDRLENAYTQPYAEAIAEIAKSKEADYVFFSASARGKAISALASAYLKTAVVSDCVQIQVEDGELSCQRPVYAGKALSVVKIQKKPGLLSLRPNVFSVEKNSAEVAVENFSVNFSETAFRVKVVGVEKAKEQSVELSEASIIVSGGRGLKEAANFSLIEGLADPLGAAVGASRAVVDDGWRPHKDQVGQTGKTVSPNLYIACGISGAIQHLAGMRTSKVIVAINKDEEAPIFKVADYGIVGDVFEVLPKMTEEAKKLAADS